MVKIPPKSKLFTPREQVQDIANTRRGVEVQLDLARERATTVWRDTEIELLSDEIAELQIKRVGVVTSFNHASGEVRVLERRLRKLATDEKLVECRAKVTRLQKLETDIRELETPQS